MSVALKTGLGALGVGLLVGASGLLLWRDVRSEVPPVPAVAPLRPAVAAAPAAAPSPADLDLLAEVLAAEVAAREELEGEVAALREELEELRTTSQQRAELGPGRARFFGRGGFDEARLEQAGVDPARISELRQAYEQSQLDLLTMRDEAMRQGLAPGGEGFAQLAEAQAQHTAQLQEELGLEDYDLMLFAAGQPNRIVVRDVLAGSSAESAGLLPGDLIRTYGSQPVFSVRELRHAISQSPEDTPVDVQVERDGLPATVRLTAGPMGVRLRPGRREPGTR